MEKTKKRILLILISILILIIGITLYFLYPLLKMKPAETGSINNTNVFALRNGINSIFFIKSENGYIMIDAGSSANKIEASLKENDINVTDVKWILLTHSDSDHVNSLPLFSNAEIYMSEDEINLANGTIKRNLFSYNSLPVNTDEINLLYDGQELLFDNIKVECIKTPGHTDGTMIYLIDDKYLFTGDAFMVSNNKLSVHPFTMDKELAGQTITSKTRRPSSNSTHFSQRSLLVSLRKSKVIR
ncbi:MAG: MBL fold metallo-hydrolase [Oscillospiraceae bacterium]|nr:MBL fold metallo-hydrolase [Oscillospiraceae bacterium]